MKNYLKYIKPLRIILIISCMIFSLFTCQNKLSEKSARKGSEKINNGLFIVRLVSVQNGSEEKFVDHLNSIYLPVWSDLLKRGRLLETSVFQINALDSSQTEDPPRNFLIISHLPPKTLSEQLFESEKEIKDTHFNETTFFTVIRSEVMVPTLNSYYPMIILNNYERVEEVEFFVEFIDVNNSPEDLELYHSLMSSYFGPVNGILVEKNLLFSFTAFETEKVISNTDDEASWNQIHINGDFPECLDLNWDSLYTDLIRKEFLVDLDSIWDLLPGIREFPPYYSGHFIKELHVH